MNLQEVYQELKGDYHGVMSRLQNENLIHKLVLKFLDDKSFENLNTSLKEENLDEAFRYVHTLKGICANFGFTNLYNSSVLLTEELRNKKTEHVEEYFEKVKHDYNIVVEAIKKLDK